MRSFLSSQPSVRCPSHRQHPIIKYSFGHFPTDTLALGRCVLHSQRTFLSQSFHLVHPFGVGSLTTRGPVTGPLLRIPSECSRNSVNAILRNGHPFQLCGVTVINSLLGQYFTGAFVLHCSALYSAVRLHYFVDTPFSHRSLLDRPLFRSSNLPAV